MNKPDKKMADEMLRRGFPYTAKYLLKFGIDSWNPFFINGMNNDVENFYRKCVEQNKRWDEVNVDE